MIRLLLIAALLVCTLAFPDQTWGQDGAAADAGVAPAITTVDDASNAAADGGAIGSSANTDRDNASAGMVAPKDSSTTDTNQPQSAVTVGSAVPLWQIAAAFAGFFFGSLCKYFFDRRLDDRREENARKSLANELLAELRNVFRELTETEHLFSAIRSHLESGDFNPSHSIGKFAVAPRTPVFAASVGRLGLLGPTVAGKTIDVFARIDEVAANWIAYKENADLWKSRLFSDSETETHLARVNSVIANALKENSEARTKIAECWHHNAEEQSPEVRKLEARIDEREKLVAELQELAADFAKIAAEGPQIALATAAIGAFSPKTLGLEKHMAQLDRDLSQIAGVATVAEGEELKIPNLHAGEERPLTSPTPPEKSGGAAPKS